MFMLCANNKGADQPPHPGSLINAFFVRRLDSIILLLAIAIPSIHLSIYLFVRPGLQMSIY